MLSQLSTEFNEKDCKSSDILWIEHNCRNFEDWFKVEKTKVTKDRPRANLYFKAACVLHLKYICNTPVLQLLLMPE